MYRKLILKLAMGIALVFGMGSCSIPLQTVVHGPLPVTGVPKGFSPERDVLLVSAVPATDDPHAVDVKRTAKLDEELKKHYPYRYKIVTQNEILDKSEIDSNALLCRYALLVECRTVQQPGSIRIGPDEGIAVTPGYKSTLVDFAFYDRLSKQRFPYSGNPTSVMRIAVSNLAAWVDKAKQQDLAGLAGPGRHTQ